MRYLLFRNTQEENKILLVIFVLVLPKQQLQKSSSTSRALGYSPRGYLWLSDKQRTWQKKEKEKEKTQARDSRRLCGFAISFISLCLLQNHRLR